MNRNALKTNKSKFSMIQFIIYIILSLLAIIYILPLMWIVLGSLKTNRELTQSPFNLPEVWQWVNYVFAWTKGNLGKALFNSFFVCTLTLFLTILLGSMAAFPIARMTWKLSKYTMTFFLLGMMVPVHCVLIPLFVQFSRLGLVNSRLGLVLPYVAFGLPLTIFLMVGFFRSLPNELAEAACIDGCGIFGYFFRIALPLAKTGLFISGLMTFIGNWNELLLAMVFISDQSLKTLPVTLTYFVSPYKTNNVAMFAAIVVAIAPTIVVYALFSNQIVEGLTAGAVKG